MMDFGEAIRAMREGKRVQRQGWNGKGMWLALYQPAAKFQKTGNFPYPTMPFIVMKTVDDQIVPWLASQTDMLAEDWMECP